MFRPLNRLKTKRLIPLAGLILGLAAPQAMGFDFQVRNIEPVAVEGIAEVFHPVFSNDGHSLFVTSESFDGLGVVDLADGKFRLLTDRAGAGYRFAQNADGSQVVCRENDFITQKLSLYLVDVANGAQQCVAPVVEHTNTLTLSDGVVAYAEPGATAVSTLVDPTAPRTMAREAVSSRPLLTEEDLKLVLYANGRRTVIDPVMDTEGRDVNYCWSSLSPDGHRMLFVAGNDCYTCLTDGTELKNLGPLHAPVWKDDLTVIGMMDSDDGHFFTASDIYAADIRTAEKMQLTPETDEIKMFPSVSPDGNRIAFHTTGGKLYIINLTTKQ